MPCLRVGGPRREVASKEALATCPSYARPNLAAWLFLRMEAHPAVHNLLALS
ncbi:MAG: hypothetical protein QW057_05345 [Candidatus Bathyarchaeia archaeon]